MAQAGEGVAPYSGAEPAAEAGPGIEECLGAEEHSEGPLEGHLVGTVPLVKVHQCIVAVGYNSGLDPLDWVRY